MKEECHSFTFQSPFIHHRVSVKSRKVNWIKYLSVTLHLTEWHSFILWALILDHVHCIRRPWVSTWKNFTQNQQSPSIIYHPLNEYPAKVDVQIRVTDGSQQHIFSGIGSCQRDDDDSNPYGGIVYIYNQKQVKLYTPISENTVGGFAFTGEM